MRTRNGTKAGHVQSGTVRIIGPATKEEKAELDKWLERKVIFEEELEEFRLELDKATSKADKVRLVQEIDQTCDVLKIIEKAIGYQVE